MQGGFRLSSALRGQGSSPSEKRNSRKPGRVSLFRFLSRGLRTEERPPPIYAYIYVYEYTYAHIYIHIYLHTHSYKHTLKDVNPFVYTHLLSSGRLRCAWRKVAASALASMAVTKQ